MINYLLAGVVSMFLLLVCIYAVAVSRWAMPS